MPSLPLPPLLRPYLQQALELLLLVVFAGCSGAQVGTPRSAGPKTVELDAIHLKAKDGKVFVRNFDETSAEADDHLKASQWQEAYDRFAFLIQEFPDHPSIGAVHYNAGLCLLHLNRPADAAPRFVAAWHKMAGSRDARDALFLAAEAQERAGLWADAAETYRLALQDPATQAEIGGALGLLDEMEARARCGIAFASWVTQEGR
jgi:TolA-binding protein